MYYDFFPWGKERLGRDADHSLSSSAEVKNEQLHLLSPYMPPCQQQEKLYFYTDRDIRD
jgi:hypothetical protein